MTKQFNAGDKITVTSLMHCGTNPDHPDILSKLFTVAKVRLDTNCVETLEKNPGNNMGYIFHVTQITLREPSFKFRIYDAKVYTAYHPYNGTDDVLVTYSEPEYDEVTYSSLDVDRHIASGVWKVIPTESEKLPAYFEITTHGGKYSMARNNGEKVSSEAAYICHDLPRQVHDSGGLWDAETIQKYLADGTWKLVEEEPEEIIVYGQPYTPLADAFTFHTKWGDALCTATRILNGNYEVIWGEGIFKTVAIHQGSVIKGRLDSGEYWLAAENVPISSTTELEVSTQAFLEIDPTHVNEEALEICLPQACSFLDSIKAFTEDYPASVFIDSGKYVIYYQDDELFADTDIELRYIMDSVKCLEKAANGK